MAAPGIRNSRDTVAKTAAYTLTVTEDLNRPLAFNSVTPFAMTLFAATGSGARQRFYVLLACTSGAHSVLCAGTDKMFGNAFGVDGEGATGQAAAANAWNASTTAVRFQMDGTTQGGTKGDWVEFEDVATGVWMVSGSSLNQSGTEATPFATS